jgi:hypothetical protein
MNKNAIPSGHSCGKSSYAFQLLKWMVKEGRMKQTESDGELFGRPCKVITIDPGSEVVCDVCNDDWTDRTESGGFIFGSNAHCPKCAQIYEPQIISYGEQHLIQARCPKDQSFADFVREFRDEA